MYPGNVIALVHFQSHRKCLSTILYILIIVVDIFSCATCLPVAISYLNERQPMWFGNSIFCHTWGILWAIIPFMSVFLVAVLSITRSISLISPLSQISTFKVMFVVVVYITYLVLWSTIPIIFKYGTFVYSSSDTYCWESTAPGWYSYLEMFNGAALLAFPVIPVLISCVISTYCVLSSLRVSSLCSAVRTIKIDATITIILITATYILLNLPIFIIWVLYIHDKFTVRQNVFLYYYSWCVCYIICVTVNATLNPFIYLARMEKFRISFLGIFSLKRWRAARPGCRSARQSDDFTPISRVSRVSRVLSHSTKLSTCELKRLSKNGV